jgi:ketosteroid isomerase-like protein
MKPKDQVMEVDRLFCKDCKVGKEKAWASYFLEDGIMITPGLKENIVGKKAIEEAMAPLFALSDVVFDWEPESCEVSGDGSLAVTRGTSKLSYTKDGESIMTYGNYTTIWKKRYGKWKISWDIGN